AGAAAARLDAEQVVQQRHDEVVVQVPAAGTTHHKGQYGKAIRVDIAKDLDVGIRLPGLDRGAQEVLLVRANHVGAHRLLEREDQARADRLDDGWRAALFPVGRIGQVVVIERVHIVDGSAARDGGHAVSQQFAAYHKHAGGARAADKLVRREEDRVLVGLRVLGTSAVHLDLDVRARGREVPERQGAVPVQQVRDGVGVRDDAGHVGGRREGADPQWTVLVADQLLLEPVHVDVPVRVLRDHDDLCDRFPPRQLVRVVLERADEDHRAALARDLLAEAVLVIELGGEPDAEDAHHLVDGSGGAGTGEDHNRLVVATYRVPDD